MAESARGHKVQMPRTFRLNLLRIQERLPEVTQGMKTTKAQHAEQHAPDPRWRAPLGELGNAKDALDTVA